jgi:hypothetical protein
LRGSVVVLVGVGVVVVLVVVRVELVFIVGDVVVFMVVAPEGGLGFVGGVSLVVAGEQAAG